MSKRTLDFCTSLRVCIQTVTGLFGQSKEISPYVFYWLLCAVPLSDKWCHCKQIGCWNKRCASCSKTDLWCLDKLSCRRHHPLAWVELRRSSLHRCNFPCNRLASSWIFGTNWIQKRETTNKIKHESRTGWNGNKGLIRQRWTPHFWINSPAKLSPNFTYQK